jgi:hypothetical protein
MTFTPQEVAYIGAQRLARVATAAADGQPDVLDARPLAEAFGAGGAHRTVH